MTRTLSRPILLLVSVALLLASCSNGAASTDDGIATLTDSSAETAASAEESLTEPDGTSEEAALAFAQCMRDGGINFPDPTVDEEGNPSFVGAFRAGSDGDFDPRSEDFREAITGCQELTEGFAFGGGGRAGFDPSEIQEALLPYTECLRDQGIDVGDFSFAQGGAGQNGGTAPDGDDQQGGGQRGPGGDPSARIARVLGLDVDDPAVEAALETCAPLLEDAFSSFAGRN